MVALGGLIQHHNDAIWMVTSPTQFYGTVYSLLRWRSTCTKYESITHPKGAVQGADQYYIKRDPHSKVHGANMGPIWAPFWPHELCYLGRYRKVSNPQDWMLKRAYIPLKFCRRLPNLRAIETFSTSISCLRDFAKSTIRSFIRSKEMIINIVHHHVMPTQTSPTWEFHCQEIAITDHLSITQSILIPTYVRSMLKQPLVITYKLCQNFTRQWLLVDGTNAFRMVQNSRSVTISTSDHGDVILWIKNDETRQSM